MANTVSGLTPFQGDAPNTPATPAATRPQVDDPLATPPTLRPAARFNDYTMRSPQFLPDANLQRLAESLSSIQPGLQEYMGVEAQQQRQEIPGTVAAALYGKSADEQKQILASNPALQNPVARNLGQAMIGTTQGQDALAGIRQAYDTNFDKQNGDFNAFIRG
ncbi:hypothetical protein [Methylovirgula sp. 4M-Z18]|uniref:hypothetical protein n=1 Tax=Methylovirgula sp. 4M-Z18 TaxID=2293567 RepID=UPI000E2FBC85|nr:hypothetical protein [Methylovirgula sp. 4M-Z18]RFB78310.1 hypothetical protein DYH55_16300 [Methylovirgula sp. 4M-Z18]